MAEPAPERFGWHPEPRLVGHDGPGSREALGRLGRETWAVAMDYLYEEAFRRPAPAATYPEMRRAFFGPSGRPAPAPSKPSTSAEVLAEYASRIAPRNFNAQHLRSFGYFTPPPLPMSVAGELLAQWANQGVDIWNAGPAAALVAEEVVAWLSDLVGHSDGFGVLTSGGVMANVMAMALARDLGLERGRGAGLEGARVYVSDQAHFSIGRALDLLGFPPETLRVLPSDQAFRLRGETLVAAVSADREAGLRPLAVAAVSGSTNTGSVDAVSELAEVAAREKMWLHVDAAYGGAVRLSAREAWRVPDLELADSVTIDPHKWFFQAVDIGGLVVRRRRDLPDVFHSSPEYYRRPAVDDDQAEPLNWYQYSMEGTRRFRALKLWMSWKHLGTEGLGRLIESNLDLAAHLANRCRESPDLDLAPERPELSVVCFRHLPKGASGDDLDRHQDRLQRGLEVSGEGWVSTTRLRGRTYLRAGILNYMSSTADVDGLLASLRRLAAQSQT